MASPDSRKRRGSLGADSAEPALKQQRQIPSQSRRNDTEEGEIPDPSPPSSQSDIKGSNDKDKRNRSPERDKQRSSHRDRSRSSSRDRHRDRRRDRSRSRDRENKARDRPRDRSRERDRPRESDKDRDRGRDNRDRGKSDRDRPRERSPFKGNGSRRSRSLDRNHNKDRDTSKQAHKPSSSDSRSKHDATKSSVPLNDLTESHPIVADAEEDDEEFRKRVEAYLEEEEDEDQRIERLRKEKAEFLAKLQATAAVSAPKPPPTPVSPVTPSDSARGPTPLPRSSPSPSASPDRGHTHPKHAHIKAEPVGDTEAAREARLIMQEKKKEEDAELAAQAEIDRANRVNPQADAPKHAPLFDMFALAQDPSLADSAAVDSAAIGPAAAGAEDMNLSDNWDDEEGYYRFRRGDVLDGKYLVVANQGSGVFSTVLRVRDLTTPDKAECVVKVIRNKETMLKAGLKELEYLKRIAARDPKNSRHCVRLLASFEHRNHLCMVFEPLYKNLREVLKKFGGIGLDIKGVAFFASQLFIALEHIKKCNILHGDIKPDNILVDEKMLHIKLCDFGSAGGLDECEITPYLVSRFYRAPEVTLGLAYNEAVDMWSVGCVLYELYTGKILFPGQNSNDMLRLIMDAKGPFPKKIIKKGAFKQLHFDDDCNFLLKKHDDHSGMLLTEARKITAPATTIKARLQRYSTEKDLPQVELLADLLEKIFTLDPAKRITCEQARHHPFLLIAKDQK